ncbi:transglycosylase SLT domain-containing protein [Silvibacterium dinghuense]|uniref:Tetratricopeptide repeat protein n=1 Tax=Silvibacterium dinghuense TaxID=1560006 RepID=A0A4Q1SH56_9BACT|nr:transglycosylase SLT domain-containing protein [Silvibacterium dinghuense]RXS96687.1 tetratricopeptide repeat protein [Silvibacterium dinghuense]GGG92886.1 murein transglycosylase [Silvibacterium dinghuense]
MAAAEFSHCSKWAKAGSGAALLLAATLVLSSHLGAQTISHKKKSTHHAASASAEKKSTGHASGHSAARTSEHSHAAAIRKAAMRRHPRRPLTARQIAVSHKLQQAFVASSQLRPMAQQLAVMRTPAAYDGVAAYAHAHTGEAAATAYLAMGHAYLLDHKYADAVTAFTSANRVGDALDDYADYLTAQAYLQSNQLPQAESVLSSFSSKHPDSIFVASIPVLEANLYIQEGDPQSALRVLNAHRSEPLAGKADFQLADAKAQLMAGNAAQATQLFRHIYLSYPLSPEAAAARTQLASSGALTALPASERRSHADALYNAGRYDPAAEEYRSLANDPSLDASGHNAMLVAAAACDWKLKRLNASELMRLPDTSDDAGARRQYLLMELARDKDDGETQRSIVESMKARFPSSPWLAEALYSSGNMYLLRKDFPTAIGYYSELARRFPKSCESPHSGPCSNYSPSAHWRAAWLTYRQGDVTTAARMFDEQIAQYAGGKEIPSALYWRARVYEDNRQYAEAAKYYRTLTRVYRHYYYAELAQEHLAHLSQLDPSLSLQTASANVSAQPTQIPSLDALQPEDIPELSADVPDQDPHLVKAKLLANAGLNEYIPAEIRAADGSDSWGAFAEASIYAAYGETSHAMRLMKRAVPFYTSAPVNSMPMAYWRILFPQSYWLEIKGAAAANGLDPIMIASLIRQETEFNPNAVSNKSAYGLMQLLPSVGKQMAHEEGMGRFSTEDLLDPGTNIRLGARYLKQTLDKFGDKPEYAFAAYNAGDNRVLDWQSSGRYRDMDEFVESIPFTETREYVQAIIRNEEIYRELEKAQGGHAATNN